MRSPAASVFGTSTVENRTLALPVGLSYTIVSIA
jgi:hypothetical protein